MNKHIFKDRAAHVPDFCRPTVDAMAQFSGKWFIFVMGMLDTGPKRFSELEEGIAGISQRMLTLSLRSLERDGIVVRTVTPAVLLRVDYALTERGRSAFVPLRAFHEWAQEHGEGIVASRKEFDGRES